MTRSAYAFRGVQVLDEHFFLWEEGHRMAFGVERGSLPLFRRFGEDYLLEPDGAVLPAHLEDRLRAHPDLAAR